MARNVEKPVEVTSDSDLMGLLDEADANSSVVLERRGIVYRLSAVEPSEQGENEGETQMVWDADAVRRNLDETLGSWAYLDTDKMIEDIYRWRREGSRDPDAIVP